MNKLLALLFAIMPIVANANTPFTKQDLIGKWECKFIEDEYFRATSDIEYRDDGTMSEHSVLYEWAESDEFYQIDTFKVLSKWQVIGDKVRYYDNIVQSYTVDMPNYNRTDDFIQSKEAMLISKAAMERLETEQAISEDMVSYLRFSDRNTYIPIPDWADEDFPTDIENNHCKRKL